MARRLIALPLYKDKDALVVAMADPLNIFGVDDIRKATGFATLHTNDAESAATRLIDMGIEPFLIASFVIGILAQGLTRKICDRCKKPYPATQELLKSLGMAGNGGTFYRGEGCPACKNTGYLGRIGLYELIDMNEAIRTLIIAKASNNAIKTAAAQAWRIRNLHSDVT